MKKLLTFSLLLSLGFSNLQAESITPLTIEEAKKYAPNELIQYRQLEYKLIDPAGDYALLKRSEIWPKKMVLKALKKSKENEVESNNANIDVESYVGSLENMFITQDEALSYNSKNSKESIQGRESPIIRKGFAKMFKQVIVEEQKNGIEPRYGNPHKWSKEFKNKYGKSSPMMVSSKLLLALAVGETNRYMKTDKEDELYNWLIDQQDSSVEISDLFRASYRINDGDVYLTLMTIENVMAHQWRNENRDNFKFVKKLKAITSGYQFTSDRFGTWYHLFGMIVYGYVEAQDHPLKATIKATVIGEIEALGSRMLSSYNKTQKAWMNRKGGAIGSDLATIVTKKTFLKHESDSKHLDPSSYLDHDEDFRDRIKVSLDDGIVASLDTGLDDRTFVYIEDTKNRSLKNCSIEMIPDLGTGLDAREIEIEESVNIKSSRSTITFYTSSVKKIRGFIKCESLDETIVFETK